MLSVEVRGRYPNEEFLSQGGPELIMHKEHIIIGGGNGVCQMINLKRGGGPEEAQNGSFNT